ncbi:Myb/SANT-like domain, harbinger transposase-derived nuclease domain protein [Tanacetum coccineum]
MFSLTNEEWDDFCVAHPKHASLRETPLPYPELCATLFDKSYATGSISRSPNPLNPSLSLNPNILVVQSEDVNVNSQDACIIQDTSLEGGPSVPPSLSSPNVDQDRPRKKSKKNIDLTELEADMRKVIANFANENKGPTIDDSHEKLKKLGFESTNPMFLAAFVIFSQPSYNFRESWMTLPSDPDVMKGWNKMITKTLGYVQFNMDNAQKVIFVILVYFYFKYFRPRGMKRKKDNTSAMSGEQYTRDLLEGNNLQCTELLRMSRDSFVRLCVHFKEKGVVGALDGTLIHASVRADQQNVYRARGRGDCYQNILAICDFNMIFTFGMAGWEGTTHDSRILNEALGNPRFNFPHPLADKYYLCDAANKHTRGFMAPYRNVRYWFGDFRRSRAMNSKEKFIHAHVKLRNVIERAFGVLKYDENELNDSENVQNDYNDEDIQSHGSATDLRDEIAAQLMQSRA